MDDLDKEIESRRRERAKLVEKVRQLDVTIAALERAASLRPVAPEKLQAGIVQNYKTGKSAPSLLSGAVPLRSSKGGRKAGDINKEWRKVLRLIYQQSRPQKYDSIILIVETCGLEISDNSVRDRIRNFVRTGLMSGDAENGFVVTEDAAERFGFAKGNEPSGSGSDENAEEAQPSSAFKLQPSPDGA